MSLLILQTQPPESELSTDSYGVLATAAMLDQDVTVVFCGEGIKQLSNSSLRDQLQNCIEFGVQKIYACGNTVEEEGSITVINAKQLNKLIQQSNSLLSF